MTNHETQHAPESEAAPGDVPGPQVAPATSTDALRDAVTGPGATPGPAAAASAFLVGTRPMTPTGAGTVLVRDPVLDAIPVSTAAAVGIAAVATPGVEAASIDTAPPGGEPVRPPTAADRAPDDTRANAGSVEAGVAMGAVSPASSAEPAASATASEPVGPAPAGRRQAPPAAEPVLRRRRLAIVGFGSVGRALVRLLDSVRDELATRHGVAFDVTLLATRGSGVVVDPLGIPPAALETLAGIAEEAGSLPPMMAGRHVYQTPKGMRARGPFREAGALPAALASPETPYDVLLELSTVAPADGQPAADHLRAALGSGRDAVSANKAPVAWYGAELSELAGSRGAHLRHEATTMDCLPVHAVRGTLVPVGRIERFAGVVNSTTNIVLSTMAVGGTAADGMSEARRLGIAEADATNDTSGLDAALKATILANLLLDPVTPMTPDAVDCEGIRDIAPGWPAEAAARGARVRLVARGEVLREPEGTAMDDGDSVATPPERTVRVSVRPEELPLDDPLACVNGASMALTLETEHAGRLTLTLTEPHVQQTAYALLMDLLAIDRARG